MKLSLFISAIVALAATSSSVVSAQGSDNPIGPLTTNNAQSACVQYGDCTALPASNTYMTATQYSPITPPASSQATSAPTDAAETQASLSRLAATGAAAAFSNLSNGSDGAGGPATTTRGSLTGDVIVGSMTTSGSQDTGTGKPNGAVKRTQGGVGVETWAWVVSGPVGAALLGAFMLAI